MKRFFILIFVLPFFITNVCALSWEEISSSDKYYFGEGYGETLEEAKQSALSELIRKISMHVSSKMEILDDEILTNDKVSTESYFRKKVETFSEATLNNAKSFDFEQNSDFGEMRYGYYVEKTEVDKVFDARRQKIAEYIIQAQKAEQIGKIDDALRQYYWAFQLVKTLPLASKEKFTDPTTQISSTLAVWLPQQINNIFSDIRIKSVGQRGINNILEFTYKNKPITSIDYTYNDGKRWSNMFSAKDGRGVAELVGEAPVSSIRVRVEYAYRNESHIDYEVAQVVKVVKGKAMRKSFIDVILDENKIEDKPIASAAVSSQQQGSANGTATTGKINNAAASQVVSQFISALKTNDSIKIKSLCTADGYSLYTRLMKRGNAKLLPLTDKIEYQQMGNQTLVRSLPMSFSFAKSVRKSFVENVTLAIENNKIDNISFALEKITFDDIMSRDTWTMLVRQQIICFLENYQTAFALKRLDYIERIFADDAIIITGKVVKKVEETGDGKKVVNKYIQRTQHTKEKYIKNLAGCFNSNEFISIRFGSTKVIKANPKMGEVYGIQVKQDYYSTHYGDSGYLYLQVDMADPKLPVIRVRTWQDQPDPELGRIYGMGDFD